MAIRPVFMPSGATGAPVLTRNVEFVWHAGLAPSQKRRSIASLHQAANANLGARRLLEISSKSEVQLGVALSAFNLHVLHQGAARPVSLENVFQASKIFEFGGPFHDLLNVSARDAKRDERIRGSGNLKNFCLSGETWPIEPQTAFYDWLYLNAIVRQPQLANALIKYDGFTDIEFNPTRSTNCQAYSAALFVSLSRSAKLNDALVSKETFLGLIKSFEDINIQRDDCRQGRLF